MLKASSARARRGATVRRPGGDLAGRRRPAARRVAVVLVGAAMAGAGGCADGTADDPLQVADTLSAATPATSPTRAAAPAGRVLALDAPIWAAAVDRTTRTLAVSASQPDRLLLFDLRSLDAVPRTVPLPGAVRQLDHSADGELLAPVPSANALLRISLTGTEQVVRTVSIDGAPAAAATVGRHTVVAAEGKVVV